MDDKEKEDEEKEKERGRTKYRDDTLQIFSMILFFFL